MMKFNTEMKNILEKINSNRKTKGVTIDFNICKQLLLPDFLEMEGCVLLNIFSIQAPKKINIDAILNVYGDRTGYEASRNELRINDYLEISKNREYYLVEVALQLMEVWGLKLKAKFPESEFCFIIGYNEGYVTIRFHKIRLNEMNWLADDLEAYEKEGILTKVI